MANGNPAPYAQNAFNAAVNPIDFTKAGTPTIQMYHGGTILVNENIVGRINSWQPAGAYTREGTHIYEVNSNTWGVPVDYVPGRATGFNITFTRNEVWSQELEIALGYGAVWDNLTDQTYPFTAKEMLYKGATVYRIWSYFGCWFTEKNPSEWSNEGNGVISVSCGMAYVSRKKTSA
jgi:hypothetical protein